jgi:hypothetical protein
MRHPPAEIVQAAQAYQPGRDASLCQLRPDVGNTAVSRPYVAAQFQYVGQGRWEAIPAVVVRLAQPVKALCRRLRLCVPQQACRAAHGDLI